MAFELSASVADMLPVVLGEAFVVQLVLAVFTWLLSLPRRDVSIVDSVWGLLIFAPAAYVAMTIPEHGPRVWIVLLLSGAWAARLGLYIHWRHRGQPEDRRYQAIRQRNEPNFEFKSLYLVFVLQAVLAGIVSVPLVAGVVGTAAWHPLDALGLLVILFGLGFEAVADAQLAHFKADPAHRGQVMSQGLWHYTRHPNYFGECCVWWGFGLIAIATGAWWALVSPLLMTWLLLRVSGVSLLESDIGERRPAYRDYVLRTNAFLPGKPRNG